MPFKKNDSRINRNGRPKGSTNKITDKIKSGFEKLVADNLEGLQQDLDAMSPKDKVQALSNLSKYILPTLKQSEVSLEADVKTQELNDDMLKAIVDNMNL